MPHSTYRNPEIFVSLIFCYFPHRIEAFIELTMGRITVFSDQLCIESLRVKEMLELNGLSYVEIDLSSHPGKKKIEFGEPLNIC